jgi:ornithine carbamoyltransferase
LNPHSEVGLKKDIRTLLDLSEQDFKALFDRARELKARKRKGIADRPLIGKSLGLVFEKPSTRTRISFETAMVQLGGTPIYIGTKDTQMARQEPVKDTARVLSRYLDALAVRTYSQAVIEEFAAFAGIPVINALSDLYHPCQVLSDLLTVIEYKGGYAGLKIVWVGDGNNVAHSWINAAAILGLNLVLACPQAYQPDSEIVLKALEKGRCDITILEDPVEAVADADVVYTDVWASMGQDAEREARLKVFQSFQVNDTLLEKARKDVIVMHCLPVHREEEMSETVLEGSRSVVWDQSENKLHMHKAILEKLIG